MTYVLAWKNKDNVFLAGDTALTSSSNFKNKFFLRTSFGQRNIESADGKNQVEERVFKLFIQKNVSIGIAGNYKKALNFVETFYENIKKDASPRASLEAAVFKNILNKENPVQAVVCFYANGPRILSFNENGEFDIREVESTVQIGNPLPIHQEKSKEWIEHFSNQDCAETNLVLMLSVLQSYNIFSPQMERGIGGAFGGLLVGEDAGKWQPDILFFEHGGNEPKVVGTAIRHGQFVISSPIIGESRIIASFVPPLTQDFVYKQSMNAKAKGKALMQKLEYEYIVIFGIEKRNITVLEMKRNTKHALIQLERRDQNAFAAMFMPQLKDLIKRDGGGAIFIPFESYKRIKTSGGKIKRTDINYN